MATKQADKMYGNSPKSERDPEDGKVKVKKADKAEDKEAVTEGGAESEGANVDGRHAMERMNMYHAHEHEHHAHKGGDKHEMHVRHEDELKMLHKKHEIELGGEKK